MDDLEKRLATLWEYSVMDSPPEQAFDDITRLASFICGTPIALLTLLDLKRQWFKSKFGLAISETPIGHAFCTHAIKQQKVFLVTDASRDERFASNPLVTGEPGIRFYAGAPLVTPEGVPIGTLCVIDRVSRSLTEDQQEALAALARQAVGTLELRKNMKAMSVALDEAQAAKREIILLQRLLPLCGLCHKGRDDSKLASEVENYLATKSELDVILGACPECAAKLIESAACPAS